MGDMKDMRGTEDKTYVDISIDSIMPTTTKTQIPPLPVYSTGPETKGKNPKQTRSKITMLILLILLLCLTWAIYTSLFSSSHSNHPPTSDFSLHPKPSSKDTIQIATLPTSLLPQIGRHHSSNRLIVVGDIHGMKDALLELLEKVGFDRKFDHLILAGDMISKGPDSVGVVDLAIKLGATGIRGNHEDRVILAWEGMVKEYAEAGGVGSFDDAGAVEEGGIERRIDEMEKESSSLGEYKQRALAKMLGKRRMNWLKECPIILRVGELGNMGEVVVVHAGLAPGVRLEKQDPNLVMSMRTINDDGVPSDEHEGKAWWKSWNKYQKSLSKSKRSTVIYGHDSKRGLQIEKYSMGIDTGCLRGGKLTAVVIEGGKWDHSHKVVHVNCKDGRDR